MVSEPAAQALVNLSQKPELAGKMVEMHMVRTSMETLYKQDCEITSLLIMLLVNLTQLDAGIDFLLQVNSHLFFFSTEALNAFLFLYELRYFI